MLAETLRREDERGEDPRRGELPDAPAWTVRPGDADGRTRRAAWAGERERGGRHDEPGTKPGAEPSSGCRPPRGGAARGVTGADPLIVTLEADARSQARFDAARERWFPPERNVVPAHVTLFHQLPGERAGEVALRLGEVAGGAPPPRFRVASVMPLGRGAAYRLDLPEGDALRGAIGAGFEIVAQDRGRLRAHVTVQNKVSREEAAETLEVLRAGFVPWEGEAAALRLWWYRGGPWEAAGRFPFAGT